MCEICVKIGVKIDVKIVPEGPKRPPNGLRENSKHVVKKVSKVHFAWETATFEKFSQGVPSFHAKSHTIFHNPNLEANLRFHGTCEKKRVKFCQNGGNRQKWPQSLHLADFPAQRVPGRVHDVVSRTPPKVDNFRGVGTARTSLKKGSQEALP